MKFQRFFIVLIALLLGMSISLSAQTPSVQWNNRVEHLGGDSYRLLMKASITDKWHMYDLQEYEIGPNPTTFAFTLPEGVKLDGKVYSIEKPVREFDEAFGVEIGYYEGSVTFVQKLRMSVPKATVGVEAEWMLCTEGTCMPPDFEEFSFEITAPAKTEPAATGATTASEPVRRDTDSAVATAPATGENTPADVTQTGETAPAGGEAIAATDDSISQETASQATPSNVEPTETQSGKSLWGLIIEAILWGFAALLTPCVFPMVPMTVSFFMKGSKNPVQGRFRASMYGFFIIALYTIPIAAIILITRVVGGDAVTANIFNWIATHWLPNILFFLVFMIFAASFFGAFEITLPSRFVNKSDKNSDRGGLGGVFFMALTLVLVSFSCTGPIVSMVVIKSVQGEFWEPIITMLAFSAAFALPFALLAFFPSMMNKLPKSGGWLNSVKVVLGFIEVALGLKFLSVADQTYGWGLLDREIYLAIWIVVFTLLGLYLLGKIKFAHDSEVKHIGIGRLALVIIVFSFVVYMIPGMWGAPLKGLSGYLPPLATQDFILGGNVGSGSGHADDPLAPEIANAKYNDQLHMPPGFHGFFDLEEAEAYSRKVNKPVFVDITGHGCVNCREMESRVWTDPQVSALLRDEFVMVALYVDNKNIVLPEEDWITTPSGKVLKRLGNVNAHLALEYYGQNAQPYYIIQDADRNILVTPKGYDLSVPNFVEFLKSGLEAYRARR